jgi:hypothetical protein
MVTPRALAIIPSVGTGERLFRFFDFREVALGEARLIGQLLEGDPFLRPEGLDPLADFGLDDGLFLFHVGLLSLYIRGECLCN